jgi:isoleucyl-tRNA synthetase
MAEFPEAGETDSELLDRWNRLFEIRSSVQKALEARRNDKLIGASLEARVILRAGGETYSLLNGYNDQLPAVFIVSQVEVHRSESEKLEIEVERAAGEKCERCWNWSETVGSDARFPTLDARCVRQIEEGWL